jgi:glucose-1-phosphate thymidylyltransferase
MKALILAAGYATRLYPLTKEYPKPLLTVAGRPIIDYIVDKINNIHNIDEIIVVTNSKFISKFKKWVKGLKLEKKISLVDDLTKNYEDRRGAIGDMLFSIEKKRLKESLLVVGGDNIFDGELDDFLSFALHLNKNPVIGAYDIKDKREARKYGVIKLDKRNKVIDFQEKPDYPKSTLIGMCLYYFPKERLSLISEYLSFKKKKKADRHDAIGFYLYWLTRKIRVYGFKFSGRWYDIGHHRSYDEARQSFKIN